MDSVERYWLIEVDCQLSVRLTRPTTEAPASVRVERMADTSSSEAPGRTTRAIFEPDSEPVRVEEARAFRPAASASACALSAGSELAAEEEGFMPVLIVRCSGPAPRTTPTASAMKIPMIETTW